MRHDSRQTDILRRRMRPSVQHGFSIGGSISPVFYFRPESFLRSVVRLGPVEILWPMKNRHTISPQDIAFAALPEAFRACICCRRETPQARISVSFMIKFLLEKQAFLRAYRTKTIPIGRTGFDPGRIRTCSQSTGSQAVLPSSAAAASQNIVLRP